MSKKYLLNFLICLNKTLLMFPTILFLSSATQNIYPINQNKGNSSIFNCLFVFRIVYNNRYQCYSIANFVRMYNSNLSLLKEPNFNNEFLKEGNYLYLLSFNWRGMTNILQREQKSGIGSMVIHLYRQHRQT